MNESILSIKNLHKNFGSKKALGGITLTLEKGEILGLVGPNGSGKTTLIKCIMGLLMPTSGSIKLFGKNRDYLTQLERRDLGYVAEEPNLYEFMSAAEIIKFTSGFYPDWNQGKCEALLSRFNLPPREKIKNFSRGMKTQLALVLALAAAPRLLILDEPLQGLDPLKRIEFINLILEEFIVPEERTILISSHYLEELERLADRIAFISGGTLKKVVAIEQIKQEEKTIRVVFQKEPPPELLQMPGIKSIQKEGSFGYLIAVEENFNAIYEACSRFPHYVLDIYHRNLEDLFYDFSGR
ncbi:MAG TPA: ABC transporter ATP-binding protein, partial [Firmicutes bacterium]|nr:ABC transporter ATP-binding protein [Bacillota bacterium]